MYTTPKTTTVSSDDAAANFTLSVASGTSTTATDTSIIWLYVFIISAVMIVSCLFGVGMYFLCKCLKKKKNKDGRFLDSDDDEDKLENELANYNSGLQEMQDLDKSKNKKKKYKKKEEGDYFKSKYGSRVMNVEPEVSMNNGKVESRFGNDTSNMYFDSQNKSKSRATSQLTSNLGTSKKRTKEREPIAPKTEPLPDFDPMAPGVNPRTSRKPLEKSNTIGGSRLISSEIVEDENGKKFRKIKVVKKVLKKKPREFEN